jgi:hypothetical protein
MPYLLRAALVAGLLGLGACGATDTDTAERGTLEIAQERQPDLPLGVEGSASYVVVKNGTETVVHARAIGADAMGNVDLLTRSFAPGEYRVIGFQRYCGADACMSGHAEGRRAVECSDMATVTAGETTRVAIRLWTNGPGRCRVSALKVEASPN